MPVAWNEEADLVIKNGDFSPEWYDVQPRRVRCLESPDSVSGIISIVQYPLLISADDNDHDILRIVDGKDPKLNGLI